MLSFAVNSVIQFKTKARLLNFSLNSIYICLLVYLFVYVVACVCMPQCMYGKEKTATGVSSLLSPSDSGQAWWSLPLNNLTPKVKAFIDMYN